MRRFAIASILVLAAAAASAATLNETFDHAYDVHPGAVLFVNNVNGHIAVRAWDQPRVRIHAEKRVRATGDAAKEAMAALKIEVTPTAGGLRVVTRYPKNNDGGGVLDWMFGSHVDASVEYEVTVPRSMNLDLDTTNGAIEVTDVRGSHKVGTTNGHITLERCAGDVDAETTNGGIKAELTEITPGKSMRFETTNGAIHFVGPPNFAARVDAATTNGSINTSLPVSVTTTGRHTLRGTMNGGGPELLLRTTNGSIDIGTVGR